MKRVLTPVLLILAIVVPGTAVQAAGPKVVLNIPAGDASKTLFEFYVQSQVQLLYLVDAVKGVQTNAVTGEFVASDALARMLEGTPLIFGFESDHAAYVKPALSLSVGAPSTAQTEAVGAAKTQAHPTAASAGGGDPQAVAEVVVTGSYIRGVTDIPSPLVFLKEKEMRSTAYATVQDAVQTLPVNFRATQNETFTGAGNFNKGSGLNLRGLGSSATLVLINGYRQPQAGLQADFVDVSNIPWSIVDRIEVLPDGSSALYGSDAIAGVVNIILRDTLNGADSQFRFGMAPDGAAERMIGQLFGDTWKTGKWLLAYQYMDRTTLEAGSRAYAASADKRPLGGRDHRSFRSSPGNILDPRTLAPVFAIPAGQDGTSLEPGDLLPGVVNRQNRFEQFDLLPDRDMHSVFLRASQAVGDSLELFGEGRYSLRSIHYRAGSQPLEQLLLVPASNPFFVDPFGGSPFVIVAYNFIDDLGPYIGVGDTRNLAGSLGMRIDFSETWKATLSTSYGQEKLSLTAYNQPTLNMSIMNAALADPNPLTAFNPFGDGAHNNPSTLAMLRMTQRFWAQSEILSSNIVADGPVMSFPAGDAKLAVGAEYRQEDLSRILPARDQPGPLQQYGRKVVGAFTELSLPLIGKGDNSTTAPRLEASLAGRYEQYSDFGRTYNPKVGLRWVPLESLKLRASWGSSYKAPKLIDLYDKSQTVTGLTVFPDPLASVGQSVVIVQQGSNPDLKEETATTLTAGIDFAPAALQGFTASLTGYAINYKDQIIQPGGISPFDILRHEDQWQEVVTRNPSRAQVDALCDSPEFRGSIAQCKATQPAAFIDIRLRNFATTRMRGLDLKLDRLLETDRGQFDFGINGSYILDIKRAFTRTSPAVNLVDTAFNPLALRIRGTAQWHQYRANRPGFGAGITVDYAGSYENPNSPIRPTIDAWTRLDLQFNYRTGEGGSLWDNMEVSVNAVNLFDKAPPFVDWEWGHDIFNADPAGRVVSIYLQKKW